MLFGEQLHPVSQYGRLTMCTRVFIMPSPLSVPKNRIYSNG